MTVCTERRASMDVDGWGYVECIRGEHEGACRFGPIVHDDGERAGDDVNEQYWNDGRYNGMTFEEYVAKAHEVMETNRRVEQSLRDEVAKLEAQYLDAFDQVTGYIGAVQDMRSRYPEDVFLPDGTTPDAAGARFARMICDEINRLATEKHMQIVRSRRGD